MQEQKSFLYVATGHVVKPMVHIHKGEREHRSFLKDDEAQMTTAIRIHSTLDFKEDNK